MVMIASIWDKQAYLRKEELSPVCQLCFETVYRPEHLARWISVRRVVKYLYRYSDWIIVLISPTLDIHLILDLRERNMKLNIA